MMIVTCCKCKKKIHKFDKCPYCGNSAEFEDVNEIINVHENVFTEYSELSTLLSSKKFDQLIEESRTILKWMPKCSSVFWIRLLAKNECKTDAELIQKGINCADSADFYNAYRYGTPDEKSAYADIKNLIEKVYTGLKNAIITHEYEEKAATSIIKCQKEFNFKLEEKSKELFTLWKRLEKVEQDMYVIEQECKLLLNEHKISLKDTENKADRMKIKINPLRECTYEEFHKYVVGLGNILNQSEVSKKEIELMRKQLPWIEKFNGKVREREEINLQITSKLSDLKSYENRVKSTVSEVEHIEKRHQFALRMLADYDFKSTIALLGIKRYEAVLKEAGLMTISSNGKENKNVFDN